MEQEQEQEQDWDMGKMEFAPRAARFYSTPLTMVLLVRFLIRAYQWTVSPLLSWLGGPSTGCRFHPTCSAYFLEAVERHGALRGSWLGLKRLGRCQPWGGQGEDPVPTEETFEVQRPTSNAQCRVCE